MITRGFKGRGRRGDPARVPPGQYVTDDFPVLSAGPTPRVSLDPLELRGPLGGWFTWTVEQGGPLALVAGGSGVVPLMAMVRHRAARASAVPTRLLCSWRTEVDVIYRDELARLAARNDGLEVRHTLTRGAPAGWPGETRRIDRQMLLDFLPGADARPLAYVCGPTPLVESVAALLVSIGHAPERIRTERFGPTGGAP